MRYDIVKMSSKGQIVIPKEMRNELSLKEGDQLVAMCDGNTIVLKLLEMPTYDEFIESIHNCQADAKDAGLTPKDLEEIIKQVRAESDK